MRTNRRKVGPRTRAKLEQHRFARGQRHDVFHVVSDALNKARRTLWILVRILWHLDGLFRQIPMPIALVTMDAVLRKETHVEPHGRVEGTVLVQAQPAQVAVEPLTVVSRGKITVRDPPIRDRSRNPVYELPNTLLTFGSVVFAIEVLAYHDVGRQLAPCRWDFSSRLREQQIAMLVLDTSAS